MEQPNNLTKEQLEKLKPMIDLAMPELAQLGKIYCERYPLEKTPREVVDAVTVSVSMRTFFILGAIAATVSACFTTGEKDAD